MLLLGLIVVAVFTTNGDAMNTGRLSVKGNSGSTFRSSAPSTLGRGALPMFKPPTSLSAAKGSGNQATRLGVSPNNVLNDPLGPVIIDFIDHSDLVMDPVFGQNYYANLENAVINAGGAFVDPSYDPYVDYALPQSGSKSVGRVQGGNAGNSHGTGSVNSVQAPSNSPVPGGSGTNYFGFEPVIGGAEPYLDFALNLSPTTPLNGGSLQVGNPVTYVDYQHNQLLPNGGTIQGSNSGTPQGTGRTVNLNQGPSTTPVPANSIQDLFSFGPDPYFEYVQAPNSIQALSNAPVPTSTGAEVLYNLEPAIGGQESYVDYTLNLAQGQNGGSAQGSYPGTTQGTSVTLVSNQAPTSGQTVNSNQASTSGQTVNSNQASTSGQTVNSKQASTSGQTVNSNQASTSSSVSANTVQDLFSFGPDPYVDYSLTQSPTPTQPKNGGSAQGGNLGTTANSIQTPLSAPIQNNQAVDFYLDPVIVGSDPFGNYPLTQSATPQGKGHTVNSIQTPASAPVGPDMFNLDFLFNGPEPYIDLSRSQSLTPTQPQNVGSVQSANAGAPQINGRAVNSIQTPLNSAPGSNVQTYDPVIGGSNNGYSSFGYPDAAALYNFV